MLINDQNNMISLLFFLSLIPHQSISHYDYKAYYLEQYIAHKEIHYKMWGIWPYWYDCGWIVTEAYRKIGYRWFKLNSHGYLMDPTCRIPLSRSRKWDVLINTNAWQWHVALISENIDWRITILDYVSTHNRSSYRYHGNYSWVYAVSKDCMLNQKYWIKKK